MEIQQIKTLFYEGWYTEALSAIEALPEDSQFEGLCYQGLILCLKGDIPEFFDLVDALRQEYACKRKINEYIVIVLETCLYAYQGREKEIHTLYQKAKEILSSFEKVEKGQVREWEGWLHYAMGFYYTINYVYDKPAVMHLETALSLFKDLPRHGGSEWVYLILLYFYSDANQAKNALECCEQMKKITTPKQGVIPKELTNYVNLFEHVFKGNIEFTFQKIKEITPIFRELGLHWLNGLTKHNLGVHCWFAGNFQQAISYYRQSMKIIEEKRFYMQAPWNMLAQLYIQKGDYQSALATEKQWLQISEENENRYGIIVALLNISDIQFLQGEYSKALNTTLKVIRIIEELDSSYYLSIGLNSLGNNYKQLNKFDDAIRAYEKALKIAERVMNMEGAYGGKSRPTGRIRTSLADIYSIKGEFDTALKLMNKALKQVETDETYFFDSAHYRFRLGIILLKKGDYNQAKTHLESSLKTDEQYGNVFFTGSTLYYLIITLCELDLINEAQKNLARLEQIIKDTDDLRLQQEYQIARAVILKKSPRAKMLVKAQEIFTQVIENYVDISILEFALLNLLELLVWELSSTGTDEVLQEIQDILAKLKDLAEKQKSFVLEINILCIQGQVELVQGNIDKAMSLLDAAFTITMDFNLQNHKERIKKLQESVEAELNKWIQLTEQNAPLIDRIQQSQVQDYISTALQLAGKGPVHEQET
jgi:tetratricopeptide (TPR) repeat protein